MLICGRSPGEAARFEVVLEVGLTAPDGANRSGLHLASKGAIALQLSGLSKAIDELNKSGGFTHVQRG